jgi:hypothetical protein
MLAKKRVCEHLVRTYAGDTDIKNFLHIRSCIK